MLRSNSDGMAERDEVRGIREGNKVPPFFNNEHFRAPHEKNRTLSTSLNQSIVMVKKKEKKMNYYAGRVGFKGAFIIAAASHKSFSEVVAKYPQWTWENSDKDFFDSISEKNQLKDGR